MGFARFLAWAGIKSRAWIAQPGKSAVATAILGVLVGSAWRIALQRCAGPASASAQQAPEPSRAPQPGVGAITAQPAAAPADQRISDTGL
jgi:hypothetical protein